LHKPFYLGLIVALSCVGCAAHAPDTEAGNSSMRDTDLQSFVGITWVAEDIDGRGVMDTLQSQLRVVSATEVAGLAGCNQYTGTLAVTDRGFRIGPLASTRKMCPPAIMDQEERFLRALENVQRARTQNGLLYLLDADGSVRLRFWRSKEPR
jgi:heat shock protein HslJ